MKDRPALRFLLRWTFRLGGLVIVVALATFLFLFRTALYHRFYLFPKQAQAWEQLRAQRMDVALDDGWNEYRGGLHCHSELSHDSTITFPEIVEAAHQADINFLFMADHCDGDQADFSKQWKGLHDGVLFIRGFEMGYGFMPWGLPDDTVLIKSTEPTFLAKQIRDKGGLLFIAHSEEPREWQLLEINGMEIYNLHTDFKGEEDQLFSMIPDFILSLRTYPDQLIRTIFDRQTDILKLWDELNKGRKMVGMSANDAHRNTGFRGIYTADDKLRIMNTARDVVKEWPLNFWRRTLLRLVPGPLEMDREIFRIELDPYERSLRFVNTHLLAKDLTEPDLVDALRQGRAFVAFDMIADSRGFTFLAENSQGKAVMGESLPFEPGTKLKAGSPISCRLTLMCDGNRVDDKTGNVVEFDAAKPGKYRIEADFNILGEWTPWVYTNPIEITAPSATPGG
ncbi:MAG: PHP domain-containing protein [Candidatus Hydrogenedentes bacterium]|nr:PHP domain-containing protein [Candidatus Hydrogenedentota bacterium]